MRQLRLLQGNSLLMDHNALESPLGWGGFTVRPQQVMLMFHLVHSLVGDSQELLGLLCVRWIEGFSHADRESRLAAKGESGANSDLGKPLSNRLQVIGFQTRQN